MRTNLWNAIWEYCEDRGEILDVVDGFEVGHKIINEGIKNGNL